MTRLLRPLRLALCALVLGHWSLGILNSAELSLTTATIAELQSAMAKGTLTSEKLTQAYLARIAAYDKQGPTLNTVIVANEKALATAKSLDAERKAGKVRGPLHGIPIVLKDNYDTFDLQTTAGSQLLEGWVPAKDGYMVKKLREAGAVILAKVNLSEFAAGGSVGVPPEIGGPPNGFSSAGGQTKNPHDLLRGPAGSSGGTGSAIAAGFAQFGLGSDTGGSIRGPCSVNGIAGLKPTNGLLSRAGIVPLALSFDTGGPMARSVSDIAVSLNVTTGVDPRDDATQRSAGKTVPDYTKFLDAGALKGARIGVARDFFGQDTEVDTIIESALSALKAAGATLVDVKYPDAVLKLRTDLYNAIRRPEFKWQVQDYLATLKPGFPKTHADILALSEKITAPTKGVFPNHGRLALYRQEAKSAPLTDPAYLAAVTHGLAFVRDSITAVITTNKLDAIVYPTSPRRPQKIGEEIPPALAATTNSPTNFANLTGFPDLIIPAGFTTNGLPVGLSFFGPAWSEPKLLALGYAYEQATRALRTPVNTPALPGESFDY